MAWWDDILGLLKDEWKALGPGADGSALEPPTVKQAQTLLARTARELADAKARAEAAAPAHAARAGGAGSALTQPARGEHPRYRDRLTDLARAVAHEGDMVASFDTHIATLGAVHDRIDAQLRAFNRDVSMARAMLAASQTTQAVAPGGGSEEGRAWRQWLRTQASGQGDRAVAQRAAQAGGGAVNARSRGSPGGGARLAPRAFRAAPAIEAHRTSPLPQRARFFYSLLTTHHSLLSR